MKYIDADDLAARLIGDKYKVFREILQSEQEAIVRCKDCKHNPEETWFGCPMAGIRRRTDDTFCSFWGRKEE